MLQVDCTSLLYLCGLGLPAVVEFFVSFNFLDKPLSKSLMATLQDFDDICSNWISNVHTDSANNVHTDSSNNVHRDSANNVHTKKDSDLKLSQDFHQKLNTTEKHTAQSTETNCSSSFYLDQKHSKILPLQNPNLSPQDFNNTRTCRTHMGGATDLSTMAHGPDTGHKLDRRTELTCEAGFVGSLLANKTDQPSACFKHLHGKHQHAPFFCSNITSLCINGSVFEDEQLGLQCLTKFLTANPNVSALSLLGGVMCNLVSDSALQVVGAHGTHMVSISLEGCDHLSSAGISSLVSCRQLSDIDFTG